MFLGWFSKYDHADFLGALCVFKWRIIFCLCFCNGFHNRTMGSLVVLCVFKRKRIFGRRREWFMCVFVIVFKIGPMSTSE